MDAGYFDANATTPLFPGARDLLVEAIDRHWQNPSSLYHDAGAVRRLLEEARENFADLLGIAEPRRVVFTSGATEANNLVFRHAAALARPGDTVLISPVEHPCVRAAAAVAFPGRVREATLDPPGAIDLDALARDLDASRPLLVSIMAANNETGILHPWETVGRLCRERDIPYHCDAAQWLGKMPAGSLGPNCNWVTGSGHKFGGPKGTGFLVIPEALDQLLGRPVGGPQESGLRAGTENVPAIVAMEAALTEASQRITGVDDTARNAFEAALADRIPGVRFIGRDTARLWNTSMFIVPEFGNLKWLTRLSHLGYQVSTGSACSSGKDNPSHVMEAMGLDHAEMGRVLRASGLWSATDETWNGLAEALEQTWKDLREPSSGTREKRKIRL